MKPEIIASLKGSDDYPMMKQCLIHRGEGNIETWKDTLVSKDLDLLKQEIDHLVKRASGKKQKSQFERAMVFNLLDLL